MNLGKAIKILLEKSDLTQKELAERTGISETSISQILRNKTQPKKETIKVISESLGVSPEVLALLSVDRGDIPEGKEDLYDSLWPFVENAVMKIFSEQRSAQ